MNTLQFLGWRHYVVLLPNEQRLVCYYFMDVAQGAKDVALYDESHNIFRLDKDGNVIWQIVRDENGILNWESLHRHARERGEDGARWPFENLLVVRPDGTRRSGPHYAPLAVDTWEPGCHIYSDSAQGYSYEIDIERGVARNRADEPQRPW